MNDEFISLVGGPETGLRRVKGKPAKAEILHQVEAGALAPEQRLRGYLAIGRTPPNDLLSESNISKALQIGDRISFLPLLSRKLAAIYADEALDSILAYLVKFRPAKVGAIATGLARTVTRWSIVGNKIRISPSTSDRLIAIVELITKRTARDDKPRSRPPSRNEKALKLLARTSILWGASSVELDTLAYSQYPGLE